jgi:hypothetical protein
MVGGGEAAASCAVLTRPSKVPLSSQRLKPNCRIFTRHVTHFVRTSHPLRKFGVAELYETF